MVAANALSEYREGSVHGNRRTRSGDHDRLSFVLAAAHPAPRLFSMKNMARNGLVICALLLAAVAYGATSDAAIQVTAKEKSSGKVAYRGKTGVDGKFSAGTLAPGSYVFEFQANQAATLKVALAGAKSVKQGGASKDGLAFDVDVVAGKSVSGQVTAMPIQGAQAAAASSNNKNVKIINGKRYVFVRGEVGSQMGGKWVPEEEAVAVNSKDSRRNAAEFLRRTQDLGGQGAPSGR